MKKENLFEDFRKNIAKESRQNEDGNKVFFDGEDVRVALEKAFDLGWKKRAELVHRK